MAISKEPKPKKKTKEQRIKEAVIVAYAAGVARLPEIIERLPAPPTQQKVKQMLQNRFQLAVDSAEVFEEGWERVKAKFAAEEDTD